MFYEKGVLKNFEKFTKKHLCVSLLFNKVAGLRPATLLKNRPYLRCFPVNFSKFLRTEAVVRRCSIKKVFSEISQNSQENTCARDSFLIKLQAPLVSASVRTPFLTEHLR